MEKITEKRPELMERLLGDMNTLSDPTMLLDKLRELANHKQVQQLVDLSSSDKHSMALATSASSSSRPNHRNLSSSRPPKRKRPVKAPCASGFHNPESTTHLESKCWFLHPHLHPAAKAANEKGKASANYSTTSKEDDSRPADYAYVTGHNATRDAIILDSGANQHMFNSMRFFVNAEPTLVYIVTGSGKESNEMTATHMGTAKISVGTSTITLRNALFVPNLATNLIAFGQLVKQSASMTRTEDQIDLILNGNHRI
jgi:hypothetical protein